ncbi:MarR family transcriptional regulator [Halobacteriales archaeon QS_1_68_20]|nr:MAG: MarR family transcriptional regulator [Halobacteriales archaeon QS_1_68_20]
MTKADDYILELLADSDLVLSPAVVAYNIDYTRNYVTGRLSTLTEAGLVERPDSGMYRITETGRAYLAGELDASELEEYG